MPTPFRLLSFQPAAQSDPAVASSMAPALPSFLTSGTQSSALSASASSFALPSLGLDALDASRESGRALPPAVGAPPTLATEGLSYEDALASLGLPATLATEPPLPTAPAPAQEAPPATEPAPPIAPAPAMAEPKPPTIAEAFLEQALAFEGQPYRWGGGHTGQTFSKPSPVDCSGLVTQAARMIGENLDGTAAIQQRMGKSVSMSELKPGDLLFKGSPATHVGIYIGDGKFLHAPRTGDVVKVQSMSSYSWSSARRVL